MPEKKSKRKSSTLHTLLDWLKSYWHSDEEFANLNVELTDEEKKLLHKFRDL